MQMAVRRFLSRTGFEDSDIVLLELLAEVVQKSGKPCSRMIGPAAYRHPLAPHAAQASVVDDRYSDTGILECRPIYRKAIPVHGWPSRNRSH